MILTIGWILTAPEAREDGARAKLLQALEHIKAINLQGLQGLQVLVVLRGPGTHGMIGTLRARASGQDGVHEPRGPERCT